MREMRETREMREKREMRETREENPVHCGDFNALQAKFWLNSG